MNQVQRKSLLKRGYTITERIGDGEFGAILMVRSIRHDRRMIIKDDTLMDYYNAVDHMPEPLAYGWFAQLYSALEFVHSKGSTHRDVKLDNEPLDRQRCIRLADVCVATERPSCAPAGATPAIKTNRCRAAARCTRRRNYWTRT
ncbi:serine/threonine-protein kinase ppk16-like isoform X1 [Sipha flava]|uniref:Serine/threonine-protein kinase ppk16-like isoform X1 n=1 Tax=Sipha flava TaxID=143950 RepID=A0A8B8GQD2_9HEMI|nr:serine/threonine-protein kinase ppk16-like isoform X1 [Sipha flava]